MFAKFMSKRIALLENSRDEAIQAQKIEVKLRETAEAIAKELATKYTEAREKLYEERQKAEATSLFNDLGEAALFWYEASRRHSEACAPAYEKLSAGLITHKGFQNAMGTLPVTLSRAETGLKEAIGGLDG